MVKTVFKPVTQSPIFAYTEGKVIPFIILIMKLLKQFLDEAKGVIRQGD